MSRLRKLMEELCPNGVEYKKLGDVVSVCRGVRVVRAELQLVGKYPVYQNSLIPMGYYDKENCIAGTAFIIGAGAAGDIGYSDVPFWAADDCFYFVCEDNMNARFLYHVLVGQETFIKGKVRKASIPRLSRNVFEKMVIPVPPLEIQNEIVKLLDDFTELTAELTEQLMTELTLRKKQYNFYRDSLLNFVRVDDTIVQTDRQTDRQVQRISKKRRIGDIATFRYGYTASAATSGDARYIRITDITEDGTLNPFDARYTCVSTENSEYLLKRGDLVMARTGATYGKTLFYDSDAPAIYASFLIKIQVDEAQILPRFYWHFTRTTEYWAQADRLVTKGGQPQFNTGAIGRINIPIPPLEIQQKIVSILDRFDTLCGNLTSDLSAEIVARKRQYEHYRDKLLTFPRSKLEERS